SAKVKSGDAIAEIKLRIEAFNCFKSHWTTTMMLWNTASKLIWLLLLLKIIVASPTTKLKDRSASHEPRQVLDGTLGALAGVLGQNQTFDYVIVGAGTAGLALANRLSQNGQYQVAVIEAGTLYQVTDPLIGQTPAGDVVFCGASAVDNDPAVDWSFFTTPQTGANDRIIHYARGKCLGGSSARNFMIYQRGTRGSFQKWTDQVGDDSFLFDNVLPYYKQSCQFTPPNTTKRAPNATVEYNAGAFESTGGPLHVSYANYAQTFDSYLQPAFNEIGMPTANDFNSAPLTQRRRSAHPRKRLSFKTPKGAAISKYFQLSMAKRILFDETKTATGVLVEAARAAPFVLSARKEVVVSAGAFQSPQMLMVSGIGPVDTLNALDIPVLVGYPHVGQNMWDHVFAGPTYRVNLETFTRLANDPAYVAAQFAGPYSLQREGPLTNPVADMLGWEKIPSDLRAELTPEAQSDLSQFPDDWPELEYISGAGYVGQLNDLILDQPKDGYQYATILSTLVAPLSRGNVTITSADTNVLPLVSPNWLTSPTDQQVAIATFKRARQAFASSSLQRVVIGDEYFPGANVTTDEQILENYKNTLLTVWHASCTCAMGKSIEDGAVVDSHARVFGVQGLRVVDASAFAVLPPGHPQSTIYMLAEKVAAQMLNGE
ncbi:MAG: hypothetical protein Q9159_000895, partial [Coniocarpon cinnabarinum]